MDLPVNRVAREDENWPGVWIWWLDIEHYTFQAHERFSIFDPQDTHLKPCSSLPATLSVSYHDPRWQSAQDTAQDPKPKALLTGSSAGSVQKGLHHLQHCNRDSLQRHQRKEGDFVAFISCCWQRCWWLKSRQEHSGLVESITFSFEPSATPCCSNQEHSQQLDCRGQWPFQAIQ